MSSVWPDISTFNPFLIIILATLFNSGNDSGSSPAVPKLKINYLLALQYLAQSFH